jgi:hypothetical protein
MLMFNADTYIPNRGRRDAYTKYKVELDALYELPDPSPSVSESAKL